MSLFHISPFVFSYGESQQMSVSSKHKMVNTNRKGGRKGAK